MSDRDYYDHLMDRYRQGASLEPAEPYGQRLRRIYQAEYWRELARMRPPRPLLEDLADLNELARRTLDPGLAGAP